MNDRLSDKHLEWLRTEGSAAERKMADELLSWRRSRWLCVACLRPECEGTHRLGDMPCYCLIVDGERQLNTNCPAHDGEKGGAPLEALLEDDAVPDLPGIDT